MNKILAYILAFIFITSVCSCKKFVDPGGPANMLSRSDIFSNDATATSALLAIYANFESTALSVYMVTLSGLSSDELALNSLAPVYQDVYYNNLNPAQNLTNSLWESLYSNIYHCNSVIEGVTASKSMTKEVKLQIEAEARFLRAYCNFLLLNFYGDIPLITTTDYRVNSFLPRTITSKVYDSLESDLKLSQAYIADDYRGANNNVTLERTRANKGCVNALLSKVYLYRSKWEQAEEVASKVIDESSRYRILSNPLDVFLKNSVEQIWQIQPVFKNYNTQLGYSLILTGRPSDVYMDSRNVRLFDQSDKRLKTWVGLVTSLGDSFYFPYKYKVRNETVVTEYTSMLRLSEVYLIRAEARMRQGKLNEAIQDLNVIRDRAGLSALGFVESEKLMDSIVVERRRELFAEGSNRWFDLKRLGLASNVLNPIKGNSWSNNDILYPIPESEIQKNSALYQNPGY